MNTDKLVQDFYNQSPFPDYELDRFDSREDLKASASAFAKILDRSIPRDASIIDVGTGTGQLSAFLSLRRKDVWGIDFSESSLSKARLLKEKLGLESWHLKKTDIMNSKEIEKIGIKFDYLLCLGVLHHTSDPYCSFKNVLSLLKPGGFLAVGLYNKYGRIFQKIRILMAKTIFKNNIRAKERFISMQIGDLEDRERLKGWWNDQYLHPHESTHTVGEVLNWFKNNRVEYYQALPSLNLFDQGKIEIAGAWNKYKEKYPYLPVRLIKQLGWILKNQHEGGYWLTFGRKFE